MVNPQQPRFLVFLTLLVHLLISLMSFKSLANEAALYDLAPQGSAFLRIIDLRKNSPDSLLPKSASKITLNIKGKSLSAEAYCSASEFIYLPPGEYRKNINGLPWRDSLEAGQAYSLVVDNHSARLLKDYRAEDSRRAVLAVYNFSNLSQLDLVTAKSARPVFSSIPQGESIARLINPLKIAFNLIDRTDPNGKNIAVIDGIIFQPAVLSSLFICEDKQGVFTRWADRVGGQ